jgi:predicted permease
MRRWWHALRIRLQHFRSDSDLQSELNSHFDMEVEERIDAGQSSVEARRHARLALGDTRVAIERVRDGEWTTALEGWLRDIAFGARSLRKAPVFFLTAAMTLALGMGASTAVFSFLYGLMLRPIPTIAPSRLVQLGFASTADPMGLHNSFVTLRMLEGLRRELTSYEDISGWDLSDVMISNTDGSVRRTEAGLVTGNAFSVVPMHPYLGRLIGPFDDVPGGTAQGWPVVLSYGFWSDWFGRDPLIIGKQLRISGALATVVGVAPPEFKGLWPGSELKMYLPMQFLTVLWGDDIFRKSDSVYLLTAIGRLKPNGSVASASAELARLNKDLINEYVPLRQQHEPFFETILTRVSSVRSGLPNYITRTYSKPLYLMQGLVGLVLLLCCTNVAGLMLTKVYARQREFAVRTALGAPAWRIVRQYLSEAFLIAFTGSMLGAFLTWYGCSYFLQFFRDPMMGETMQVRPDRTVFVVSACLAIFATFFFGTLPAWRAGNADPGKLLKTRSALRGKRSIAGRTFIPIQAALSLTLVTLAALLSQSIFRLRSEQTGFDTDHVTIQTSPFYLLKTNGEAKLNLYQRMVDRIDQMAGVRSASVTSRTPLTGESVNSTFQASGGSSNSSEAVTLAFNDVGADYFRTMAIRIVSGREFTPKERSLNVCIVNQAAASLLFKNGKALNEYVRASDPKQFPVNTTCRVIGIASDAKFSDVRAGPPPTIYFPVSLERFDAHIGVLVFLINSDNKRSAIDGFRHALSEIAPRVPLVIFVTLREQMDAALGSQELLTLLSSFFGVVSLLLSGLGLYGLLSSSVIQRTSEIGLRLALGGDRLAILGMILKEAAAILGWGILAGAFLLVVLSQFVRAMLHGVSVFDPVTLATVTLILTTVALGAAFIPAWRASRVDPMVALRNE